MADLTSIFNSLMGGSAGAGGGKATADTGYLPGARKKEVPFNDKSGLGLGDVLDVYSNLMDAPITWAANGLDSLYDLTIGDLTNTRDAFTGEDIKWIPELASWFIPGAGALKGAKALGRGANMLRAGNAARKANKASKFTDAERALAARTGQLGESAGMTFDKADEIMNASKFRAPSTMYQVVDETGATAWAPDLGKAIDSIPLEQRSATDWLFNRGAYNMPTIKAGTPVVAGENGLYYTTADWLEQSMPVTGGRIRGLLGRQKRPEAAVKAADRTKKTAGASSAKTAQQAEKTSSAANSGVSVPEGYTNVTAGTAKTASPKTTKTSKTTSATAANAAPAANAGSQMPEGYVNISALQQQQADQLARDFGLSAIRPRHTLGESIDHISRGVPMSRRFLPTARRGGFDDEATEELLRKIWGDPKNYRLLHGRKTK